MREWGLTPQLWRDLPDEDRDEMLGEHDLVCPRCGNLRSVCSDESVDWHPQESVCWATATREWGQRRLQAKHEGFDYKAKDARGEPVMGPLDGVAVWVSDVDIEALRAQDSDAGSEQDAGEAG